MIAQHYISNGADMTDQKIQYSFAWYQPEQWLKLKQVVEDPSTLDDTYETWRKSAEKAIREFRANGQCVEKVAVKIDLLLIWCESKGVKPDSKARSEYVADLAQQRNK
jgi:hypothetical protein